MSTVIQDVYITGLGTFLPGSPIGNDEMEAYLGLIGGQPSSVRRLVLRQNGIRFRHYALDRNQKSLYRNSQMAAFAIQDALERSGMSLEQIDFLAAATTQGDLAVPGFASMVHGELKNPTCEVASFHGICASGVMALKSAVQRVRTERTGLAVACASEFPSRLLKASRYERQHLPEGRLPFDTEVLRWTLSDGAGASLVQDRPAPLGISLRVEWIDIRSYANQNEVCMYAGANKQSDGEQGPSWLDYASFEEAAAAGVIHLKQDVRLLDRVVKTGVNGFFDLVESRRVDPAQLDWIVCHYSSHVFRKKVFALLQKGGINLPEEKWFTNLYTKGNVGCASMYVMLAELVRSGHLRPGHKVFCMVPESGRFIHTYMLLTVVGTDSDLSPGMPVKIAGPPELAQGSDPLQASLVRRLTRVWLEFEARLHQVPIIARMERGTFTLEDYRLLLLNLRQQVIEGSRWIARAASSMDVGNTAIRSLVLQHARDEHRDYEMLERDFVAVGGALEDIQSAPKNIGSEALSAWMFHRAGQPDPLDLLGAMFIIEGIGNRLARQWGETLRDRLRLPESSVSFLLYHGAADESHLGKLESVMAADILTPLLVERIVKTAKVTARLYLLQLEEVGNI